MKIIIKNTIEKREGRKGIFAYSTSGKIKSGYLAFDDMSRNIGIVFMSDDVREKNKKRYGQAELLFNKQYEKEFGTWKIIKVNKEYLPYLRLQEIMSKNTEYELWID